MKTLLYRDGYVEGLEGTIRTLAKRITDYSEEITYLRREMRDLEILLAAATAKNVTKRKRVRK